MSFCDITLSWKGNDLPPSSITSFTFKEAREDLVGSETGSTGDSRHSEILDVATEEADFDEFKLQGKAPVTVSTSTESENTENCLMRITCRNALSSRLNGLLIVSESRTIEISNDVDGYLKSVRGKAVTRDSDTKDSYTKLYVCQCLFSEIYSNLTVKFLSLGQRTSFTIHSIVINISQNPNVPVPSMGTIDMDKLMKNVSEMGDTVSTKAKDFLSILGQYKQSMQMSQMSMFSQLQQAAATSMPAPSPMGPSSTSRNPAVAEMFSRLEAMAPPQSAPHFTFPSVGYGDVPSDEASKEQSQSQHLSCPYMAGNLGVEGTGLSSQANSSSVPHPFMAALMAGSHDGPGSNHQASDKATSHPSGPHPMLAALMAGVTGQGCSSGAGSGSNHHHQAEGQSPASTPQPLLAALMAGATDQASSAGAESNPQAERPHSDSNLQPLLATLMKSLQVSSPPGCKGQAQDSSCRCSRAGNTEESLVSLMTTVKDSTESLTRQMDEFKQEILSALSTHKSDMEKRLDSMEEKLQCMFDS